MRAQIADGSWTVENRIPTEPELMTVLGVGRNTVREAIKTLTSTVVLEIRRGSGTFVRARMFAPGRISAASGETYSRRAGDVRLRSASCARDGTLEMERSRWKQCGWLANGRSDDGVRILRDLERKCEAAVDDFAEVDFAFHLAVVEGVQSSSVKSLHHVDLVWQPRTETSSGLARLCVAIWRRPGKRSDWQIS